MPFERKCKSEFDTGALVLTEVEHCSDIFITKTDIVRIAGIPVAITTRYRLCTKPAGFGLGKHLYTLSLVPGEEMEIAISHRRKLETQQHQMMSVEQEFANSFSDTFRHEHSQKETSDFEFTAEENVKFGFWIFNSGGVKSTQEYSTHEEEFTKTVRESIVKSSCRVDQKFEIVIDMKSEVESKSAIKRMVKNPNQCYSVTYNYFQLLRKYLAELILTDIRYDFYPLVDVVLTTVPQLAITQSPPVVGKTYEVAVAKASFVAVPQPAIVSKIAATTVTTEKSVSPLVTTSGKPLMALDKPRFDILVEKVVPKPSLSKFKSELGEFLKAFKVGEAVRTYEYTVATNGVYVDSLIGQCSACEDHLEEKRRLELELMRLDIELKKKQLESGVEEDIGEETGE
ncbi:MAG: hypothetical protein AMJ46_12755 [Latescibacteria bacterium DG_63]|nr:MAG: hypothetical protein AMJ46_12755 [Latescibacteria bacterium DG_63]